MLTSVRTSSVSSSHVMLQSLSPAVTSIDPEPSPFIIVLTLYERINGVARAVATSKRGRKNFIDKNFISQEKRVRPRYTQVDTAVPLAGLGYCQDSNSGLNIYDISIYPKSRTLQLQNLNMIGSIMVVILGLLVFLIVVIIITVIAHFARHLDRLENLATAHERLAKGATQFTAQIRCRRALFDTV